MGQRTKNRIMEHSGPGHRLTKASVSHSGISLQKSETSDSQFWQCICGWEGWLTKDLDGQE